MTRVFVSAPGDDNLLPWQKSLKARIIEELVRERLEPQLFFKSGLPLKMAWTFESVDKVMRECQAAVVLAFARHRFSVDEKPVEFASEYNHYEGALALSHGLPTLIAAEASVMRGIADKGGGRYIIDLPHAKPSFIDTDRFRPYFKEWLRLVREQRDVFFGYCGAAKTTADAIINFLTNTLGLTVTNWAVDFDPGPSILQNIENAAEHCHSGIFLFTRDDELTGSAAKAAPRDNVVFEAGYFMNAKGPRRVLILREEGAKMPADLGGNVYAALPDRNKIESIQEPIRKFVDAAIRNPRIN